MQSIEAMCCSCMACVIGYVVEVAVPLADASVSSLWGLIQYAAGQQRDHSTRGVESVLDARTQ